MDQPEESANDILRDIHTEMCKAMKKKLEHLEALSASEMNAIRAFLHDNGITAIPAEGSDLKSLADAAATQDDGFAIPFPLAGKILPVDDPAVKKAVAES